jgi:hypothetical protein
MHAHLLEQPPSGFDGIRLLPTRTKECWRGDYETGQREFVRKSCHGAAQTEVESLEVV